MTRTTKTWSTALCAAALMACGSDDVSEIDHVNRMQPDTPEAAQPARYVGEVEDSDVRVAIVADTARARVFFCGGDESFSTATRWFNLERADDELSADEDDWHLRATLSDDEVHGEITRDPDATRAFTSARAATNTLSGLYEGTAECGRIGLIVSQPDSAGPIAAQGACVGDGHTPEQVNPIMPIAAESGKIRVETPAQDATTLLQPATLTPL